MIEILEAGQCMTIQDRGRYGHRHQGIALSGAMDQLCLARLNLLLENEEGSPAVEWFASKAVFLAQEEALICISGVVDKVLINGKPSSTNLRLSVATGDKVEVIPSFRSAWLYLAVSGGIELPKLLGSKSTLLSAKLGGIEGRALQMGDLIRASQSRQNIQQIGFMKAFASRTIRYIREEEPEVPEESHGLFTDQSYQISTQSNRVGYRLKADSALNVFKKELKTHTVIPGTIQLPPYGQPIVLMRDAQPTGGYPKIGYVIPCDLSRLAQCPQQAHVQFVKVNRERANEIEQLEVDELRRLKLGIQALRGV